jgi:hypothetical protein
LTSPQQFKKDVCPSADFKSKEQQKAPQCSVKNPLLPTKIQLLKQSIFKESRCYLNMVNDKFIVYLASPYGFTDAGREFMRNTMIPGIKQVVSLILNPWDSFDSASQEVEKINSLNDFRKQKELLRELNKKIGLENENSIKRSQIIIAILDGSDVDSGVASELGYAYA